MSLHLACFPPCRCLRQRNHQPDFAALRPSLLHTNVSIDKGMPTTLLVPVIYSCALFSLCRRADLDWLLDLMYFWHICLLHLYKAQQHAHQPQQVFVNALHVQPYAMFCVAKVFCAVITSIQLISRLQSHSHKVLCHVIINHVWLQSCSPVLTIHLTLTSILHTQLCTELAFT